MVPLVAHNLRRDDALLDQPAQEAKRLRGRPRAEAHARRLEDVCAIGGEDCDQAVRGRLSGDAAARHDHGRAGAVRGERLARRSQLGPGGRRCEVDRLQLPPAVPEPARVGEGRDAEGLALVAVRPHERLEKVDLVLLPYPVLAQLLQRVDETGGRELGSPDRVDHGQVRRLALGNGMREGLMQRLARDLDDADLSSRPGCIADHPRPGTLGRDDDADLGLIRSTAEPVGIDERAAATVAKDHALVRELGERTSHRRATELVARAQLVLGRKAIVGATVVPAQDLLQKQRLQLEVERNRLLGIDRHRVLDRVRESPHSTRRPRRIGREVLRLGHDLDASPADLLSDGCNYASQAEGRHVSDGLLEMKQTTEPADDAELIERAKAVLEANWLGHATSPNRRLYPHQWSWDAACIAIGYASWNQERAETELRSLFAGQWRDGLLPHIVFTDGAATSPAPTSGRRSARRTRLPRRGPPGSSSPRSTRQLRCRSTAWRATEHGRPSSSRSSCRSSPPGMHTCTGSVLGERAVSSRSGIPWESGMDNSPLWDAALERMSFDSKLLPKYERVDVDVAEATERPSDGEYDRYVYLVSRVSRARVRLFADQTRGAVRAPARALQLPSRAVEQGSRRDRAHRRGRPGAVRGSGPRALPPLSRRRSGTRSTPCTSTTTSRRENVSRSGPPPASLRSMRECPLVRAPSAWSKRSRGRGSRSASPAGP